MKLIIVNECMESISHLSMTRLAESWLRGLAERQDGWDFCTAF